MYQPCRYWREIANDGLAALLINRTASSTLSNIMLTHCFCRTRIVFNKGRTNFWCLIVMLSNEHSPMKQIKWLTRYRRHFIARLIPLSLVGYYYRLMLIAIENIFVMTPAYPRINYLIVIWLADWILPELYFYMTYVPITLILTLTQVLTQP